MLILGIDVGTTGAKASVFDENGMLIGYGFKEYGIICDAADRAEQDAEQVFCHMKEVVKRAVAQSGGNISALALSVQGDAVIPVDSGCNALGYAQLGMDYRGKSEIADVEEQFSDREIFNRTGMRIHPLNSFIKMLWVKNNDDELYKKTYKFITYSDFLMRKLGSDEFVIDYTMATRTMCASIDSFDWDEKLLDKFGFDVKKLSKPVQSGSVVGILDVKLACELGIEQGCLLVAGGHDQTCAALGAGVVQEGIALDSHGTAEVISMAFEGKRTDDNMFDGYYPCYAHTVPHMYFTFALNHSGGIVFKWFAENFCESEKNGTDVYNSIMENISYAPSSVTLIPHFNGSGTPTCELEARGSLFGLNLGTTRFDIALAVLEALCFEMRINMETLKKAGLKNDKIICVGGGARSPRMLQLKADILGIPVQTLEIREAACLGAAILAGCGAKLFADVKDAVKKLVRQDKTYYPNDERKELYNKKYAKYRLLESESREIYREEGVLKA